MKKSTMVFSSLALSVGLLGACTPSDEKEPSVPEEVVNMKEQVAPENDGLKDDEIINKETETPNTVVLRPVESNTPATPTEVSVTTTTPAVTAPKDSVVDKDTVPTSTEKIIPIVSGESAIEHLKQNLADGKNEDFSYGSDGSTQTDDYGTYYTVRMTSISMRLAGGTGSLDTFKVYEDGTHMSYWPTTDTE